MVMSTRFWRPESSYIYFVKLQKYLCILSAASLNDLRRRKQCCSVSGADNQYTVSSIFQASYNPGPKYLTQSRNQKIGHEQKTLITISA